MSNAEILIAYISKEGITFKEFAARCKLSRRALYDIIHGKRKMQVSTIYKIKMASKGEVNYEHSQ